MLYLRVGEKHQRWQSKLTPGGIGQVIGEELKFNTANVAEGIFFVDAAGVATKVAILATRTEEKLMFSIPATLPVGTYTKEVKRGYGNGAAIKTGSLLDTLAVA
ncbi:MAG: DUF4469 domain-containing protein [Cytophagales bacterium]